MQNIDKERWVKVKKVEKIERILKLLYYSLSIPLAALLIVVTLRQVGITSIAIAFITIPLPGILESLMIFQIIFDITIIYSFHKLSEHMAYIHMHIAMAHGELHGHIYSHEKERQQREKKQ